jgi:predicted secreted hydrolase
MYSLGELVSLGLIHEGDSIYWNQPRLGLTHTAVIHKGGQIVTPDGKVHRSPSGAARHYYQKPIDGWYNWKLRRTGERLDDIRKKAMQG